VPNKSNLAFLKAFGSEHYRLAVTGEKHLDSGNRVHNVMEKRVGDFKPFDRKKNGKAYKIFPQTEHIVRPSTIRRSA